jgi:hypothetical protein
LFSLDHGHDILVLDDPEPPPVMLFRDALVAGDHHALADLRRLFVAPFGRRGVAEGERRSGDERPFLGGELVALLLAFGMMIPPAVFS